MTENHPSMIQIWIMAVRPKTLMAAVAPVILGSAIAFGDGAGHWLAALAALLGALLIQIGTNLANDYFDFKKGADTAQRVGPLRVTQAGLVTPEDMRLAILLTFSTAFLIGIYLVVRGGWPVVIVGLFSLLLGIIYTGGPFPLAYNGLGDIFAFLFFGPVAAATTYYVQALAWSDISILAGCAAGCFSVALLAINNLRDIDEDRLAGKHTLIALLGRRFGQWEYITSVSLATLSPLAFYIIEPARDLILIALFSFPMALYAFNKTLRYSEPRELINVLAMTGKLQLIFTVLFTLGWLL